VFLRHLDRFAEQAGPHKFQERFLPPIVWARGESRIRTYRPAHAPVLTVCKLLRLGASQFPPLIADACVRVERAVRSSRQSASPMSCYSLFKGWLLLSLPLGFIATSLLHARRPSRRYWSSRTKYVCSVDWARGLRTTTPQSMKKPSDLH